MERSRARQILAAAAISTAGATWARAQAAYTGGTYTENFVSMNNGATGNYAAGVTDLTAAPVNSQVANWQATNLSTGTMRYVYGFGSETTQDMLGSFGFGGVNSTTDRTLASAGGGAILPAFGVRFVNNTASTFTNISLAFDVEQWRRNSQTTFTANTVGYLVGPGAPTVASAGFTTVNALAWGSVVTNGTNVQLDGNAAANRTNKSAANVNIGAWTPGSVLVLRWADGDDTGADDILGIDNVTFSAGGAVNNISWNAPAGGAWDTDANNKVWLNGSNPAPYTTGDIPTFGDTNVNTPVTVANGIAPVLTTVSNNNAAGAYTFAGAGLPGSLTKAGAGKLVLTVANTFTGVNASGGVIESQVQNALGIGPIALTNGTTLRFTTNPQVLGNVIAISGPTTIDTSVTLTLAPGTAIATNNISGAGPLTINNTSGAAVLIGDLGSGSIFTGNLRVSAGMIRSISGTNDGDLFSNSTVLTIDAGATADFNGNGDSFGGFAGAGTIAVGTPANAGSFINVMAAGDRTFTGIITGTSNNANGLRQDGGGLTTLSGKSTFNAITLVTNGGFAVGDNVLPNTDGPLGNNNRTITVGALTTTAVNTSLLIAGPYEIARPIVIQGNTSAATITLGGNLDADARFTGTISITSPIAGITNKFLSLTSASTGSNAVTFAGVISSGTSTIGLDKIGTGLAVLSNPANTYVGPTRVSEGVLRVTGSIATSSSVTVTNAGVLEVGATQTLKSLSITATGQARFAPGGGNVAATKVLTIGDNSAIAPALTVASTAKFDVGASAVIFDYGGGVGALTDNAAVKAVRTMIVKGFNATGPAFNNGDWKGLGGITSANAQADGSRAVGYALAADVPSYVATGAFLGQPTDNSSVLVRLTLAGDATMDGLVDFNDLVPLAQNYNSTVSSGAAEGWWARGDYTYDGVVDFNDLVKLAQNYNTALPSAPIPGAPANFESDLAAAFAAVPEPATLASLGAAAAFVLTRRRRHRRRRA